MSKQIVSEHLSDHGMLVSDSVVSWNCMAINYSSRPGPYVSLGDKLVLPEHKNNGFNQLESPADYDQRCQAQAAHLVKELQAGKILCLQEASSHLLNLIYHQAEQLGLPTPAILTSTYGLDRVITDYFNKAYGTETAATTLKPMLTQQVAIISPHTTEGALESNRAKQDELKGAILQAMSKTFEVSPYALNKRLKDRVVCYHNPADGVITVNWHIPIDWSNGVFQHSLTDTDARLLENVADRFLTAMGDASMTAVRFAGDFNTPIPVHYCNGAARLTATHHRHGQIQIDAAILCKRDESGEITSQDTVTHVHDYGFMSVARSERPFWLKQVLPRKLKLRP